MTDHPLPRGHIRISTRYAYAPFPRCGVSLMDLATGESVFFRPGDDESVFRETLDALKECDESIIDHVAHVALSEYF